MELNSNRARKCRSEKNKGDLVQNPQHNLSRQKIRLVRKKAPEVKITKGDSN
jgi:hypothetical protein